MTTTDPTELVCEPWCTDADLPGVQYEDDPAEVEQWIRFASEVLYLLSDSVYPGPCPEVVRPCARRRTGATRYPGGLDANAASWWGGDWRGSWGECSCNRSVRCGCNSLSEIDLGADVQDVTEVKVDGQIVPTTEYELIEGRYLVGFQRADGTDRVWPCCQRLDRAATEDETFQVTFVRGLMPPTGGVRSAASLTCELLKAARGAQDCRLPKRVTTVTRQGVTVAVLDPLTLFADGLTGLPEVDLWLASVRKGKAGRQAAVIVPGTPPRYQNQS